MTGCRDVPVVPPAVEDWRELVRVFRAFREALGGDTAATIVALEAFGCDRRLVRGVAEEAARDEE